MTKNFPDPNLDDQLAQFTESLVGEGDEERMLVAEDPELAKLQKTVLRMHQALGQAEPDPETAAEMRRELVAEWYRAGMHQGAGCPEDPFLTRLRKQAARLVGGRRQQMAFSLAAVVVVLLIAVLVASPAIDGDGLRAITGGDNFLPFAALICVFLGGLLFWSLRKRH